MLFPFVISIIIVLFMPDAVLAWGPPAHLEIGQAILGNTALITHAVRAIIERFPYDFLYGNISADIVVGKNLVEELKHCHNWKMGFKLLKKASTDSQKAFAYGYLSHLAADTVAHNHFIPAMLIRSFSARTHRHLYWELRYDALVDKRVWQLPRKMVKFVHPDNDRLLDSLIEDAPLSFRTNKTIFSSYMSIQRLQQWHRMLSLLSLSSRWTLGEEERELYFKTSFNAAVDILNHSHRAACVRKDPTGRHSLNAAKFIRKKLKSVRRSGKDWNGAMENALKWVRL